MGFCLWKLFFHGSREEARLSVKIGGLGGLIGALHLHSFVMEGEREQRRIW